MAEPANPQGFLPRLRDARSANRTLVPFLPPKRPLAETLRFPRLAAAVSRRRLLQVSPAKLLRRQQLPELPRLFLAERPKLLPFLQEKLALLGQFPGPQRSLQAVSLD